MFKMEGNECKNLYPPYLIKLIKNLRFMHFTLKKLKPKNLNDLA